MVVNEEFHHHPEFPHYRVTSSGRVFSLRSNRFLKPARMGEYVGVTITHANGSIIKRYLHRLVLEATVGQCPQGLEARHINGNRHDNRAANLVWDTHSRNERDKVAHGTAPRGSRNGQSKLTWEQAREIRALGQAGTVQRRIAALFGVSLMTVNRVVRGESWREAPQ